MAARSSPPPTLDGAIGLVAALDPRNSGRLTPIANYTKWQLERAGLPGVRGGDGGELQIPGFARSKDWDIAFDFAGKPRLLISLKSIWKNVSGTVPNRLDDLMGEAANVQQMSPEVVTGYVMLFDKSQDFERKDGTLWSEFMKSRIQRLCIRKAPMWNQGLLEGCWFVPFDSTAAAGSRVCNPVQAQAEGADFFTALIQELRVREPAIPLNLPQLPFLL